MIFLIHPIQVESVSYISAFDNILFFAFGFFALLISTREKLGTKEISVISLLLLLSVLTKETGFVFILIIFLYSVLYQRKNLTALFVCGITTVLLYFGVRLGIAGVGFARFKIIPIQHLD